MDDQRHKSVYRENGQTKLTRYYVGDYEEEINDLTGNIRKIHYLSGAINTDNSNYINSLHSTIGNLSGEFFIMILHLFLIIDYIQLLNMKHFIE